MKVYLTGGYGFLGHYVYDLLVKGGHRVFRDHSEEMDLTRERECWDAINAEKPDAVVHCAGVVGGMVDNAKRQADYLVGNVQMGLNVLQAAVDAGVKKAVVAGSSCMYPDPCWGPYTTDEVWRGAPYGGNLGYGIAKRVVAEACGLYRGQHGLDAVCAVLPNLYGPGADGTERGHFVANVVRKVMEAKKSGAKSVQMFGDGKARRELIYVEDAAKALVFALENNIGKPIMNFGVNKEYTIAEVVETIKILVGYEGEVVWGEAKDNGQERKFMQSFEAQALGWKPETSLISGIRKTIEALPGH